jgi:choline dehydrogenase-like flavoprotein
MLIMPAALPFVYQSKRVQWGYRSGPEPELDGREIDEKSGRVMGGTSSINAMIFNRGNPLDTTAGLSTDWWSGTTSTACPTSSGWRRLPTDPTSGGEAPDPCR